MFFDRQFNKVHCGFGSGFVVRRSDRLHTNKEPLGSKDKTHLFFRAAISCKGSKDKIDTLIVGNVKSNLSESNAMDSTIVALRRSDVTSHGIASIGLAILCSGDKSMSD